MRIKQDLSIALVLAVVNCGIASAGFAAADRREALGRVEAAIEDSELSAEEAARVRSLIAKARLLQAQGDENGSARAMAEALAILRA